MSIPRLALVGLAVALAAGLAGCASEPSSSPDNTVRFATFNSGLVPILVDYAHQIGADTEAGLTLDIRKFDNLQGMYADLLTGQSDAVGGGIETLGQMAGRGGEIRIASTLAENSTAMVGRGEPLRSADQLRGKRVAAITSGGSWTVFSALLEERFGVRADTDYEVVAVDNLPTGVAQVLAGTADFAVGWQPATTSVLRTSPDLRVVLTAGDFDRQTWLLCLAVGDGLDQDRADRLVDALSRAAERIVTDPEGADRVGQALGYKPGIVADMILGKDGGFQVRPLDVPTAGQLADQVRLSRLDPASLPATFLAPSETR